MKIFENSSDEQFDHLNVDQSAQSFLDTKSDQWQINLDSEEFANAMDDHDPLRYMREEFNYPKMLALAYGLYRFIFLLDFD